MNQSTAEQLAEQITTETGNQATVKYEPYSSESREGHEIVDHYTIEVVFPDRIVILEHHREGEMFLHEYSSQKV